MPEILFKEKVYAIIGAAMEAYNELGSGFLERVYQEAMRLEMTWKGIPFIEQSPLCIYYKGQWLAKKYAADFLCFGNIIIELKALDRITGNEESQLLNYLKATGLRVGVIINFGDPIDLQWKRMIR